MDNLKSHPNRLSQRFLLHEVLRLTVGDFVVVISLLGCPIGDKFTLSLGADQTRSGIDMPLSASSLISYIRYSYAPRHELFL